MNARASTISRASTVVSAEARVDAYDWQGLAGELDNYGCAVLPKLLSPEECRAIATLYFRRKPLPKSHPDGAARLR
jgi:hypothetical protein